MQWSRYCHLDKKTLWFISLQGCLASTHTWQEMLTVWGIISIIQNPSPRPSVLHSSLLWDQINGTRYSQPYREKKIKHLTCTNNTETKLLTKGLKTKHSVISQLGKLANNVPFPLTNVWQLHFASHSLLTLWCMSRIPTRGYRRSVVTLNLPMTNGVPVNVRFLGQGRGSFEHNPGIGMSLIRINSRWVC